MTAREEFEIVWRMLHCHRWIHLKNDYKLLIDAVLKKIDRAGLVSSMVETNGLTRQFFFWLRDTCHDKRLVILLSE
ncbi:MAG TPA: hypothetical protein VGP68_02055 [Gemmataceae bacterium]|jgi:hypothetical protein|nr:hypothetical protein [Gemmataceae bacterium]